MYPIAFHPNYVHPVPPGHRFPMEKYELLPLQLLRRGIAKESQFVEPKEASRAVLERVHDPQYVHNFLNLNLTDQEARRIGFLQDHAIVARELSLVQGTIDGAKLAFDHRVAFNIAGGTHHACIAHGEGFCMLNDQAIAAQFLLDQGLVKRVIIIDLDVHQGNGTADIFYGRNDVFTFSMHCEVNYPFRKSKSHLDIGLDIGTQDHVYLLTLERALATILKHFRPDFIFYQAGVDILKGDRMGKLNCSLEACAARDKIVFQIAKDLNLPIQVSMGGGYSSSIAKILEAHTNTFLQADCVFT